MRFAFAVAWRLLREGRFQSLLIVGGVTLGVAVVVYITAIVNGLQANIVERTLSTQAHIVVRPAEEANRPSITGSQEIFHYIQKRVQRENTLRNWPPVMQQIRRAEGVTAVAAMASGPGFAVRGGVRKSVSILGVELVDYQQVVKLDGKLVAGSLAQRTGSVLIGSELASDLGLQVGDRLRIQTGNGDSAYSVAGILDFGLKDLNRRWILMPLRAAQSILGYRLDITEIDIALDHVFDATEVAADLSNRTGLKVESWIESNGQLMTALKSQRASSVMIRVFVMIAVAFGIASVLVVSVVQRQREIGILRAMGTPASRIRLIFLIQGGVVGLVGSVVGSLLGGLIAQAFTLIAKNSDGSPLFRVELTAELFVTTAATATIVGVISAFAPAQRAAKLDPVEAIRGG